MLIVSAAYLAVCSCGCYAWIMKEGQILCGFAGKDRGYEEVDRLVTEEKLGKEEAEFLKDQISNSGISSLLADMRGVLALVCRTAEDAAACEEEHAEHHPEYVM